MNHLAVSHPADPPVSAATLAAFVLCVLAVLFAAIARREREPGMAWFAGGFLLLSAWNFWHPALPPIGAALDTMSLRLWGAALALGVMAIALGVVDYLALGPRVRRYRWTLLTPTGLLLASLLAGLDVPRLLGNLALMSCYLGAGLLALRQAGRERRAGHAMLGLALLTLPVAYGTLLAIGLDPARYRLYAAVMPQLFFGMTLLTVSLTRRRHALEAEIERRAAAERALNEVNHNLEETVAARTIELQELVASLEGFNRSVSHDLRGPLGGIAGLATLAADAASEGDMAMVQRSLSAISAQAETSTKLIGALLQLAHVGDAKLARRTVVLETLVRDVIAQLRLSQPVATQAQWRVARLPEVQADADLLRPVLVNLMSNALKFARDAQPPVVRIEASEGTDAVTIHVRDNGVGFAADAATQLFQPFMRLHGRRFEGHGIGLSIVRRAVERHGGRVWADAEPERGASFHFTLPKAA